MNSSAIAVAATTSIDPVCGMTVDPSTAAASSSRHGETISFCSQSCKTRFDANPEQYGDATTPAPAACCGPTCCSK